MADDYEYKVVELAANDTILAETQRLEAEGWRVNPAERAPYTTIHIMRKVESAGSGIPVLHINDDRIFVIKAEDQPDGRSGPTELRDR